MPSLNSVALRYTQLTGNYSGYTKYCTDLYLANRY